eukprot:NODE_474_length_7000_cov_1.160122.p1 type:complete len:439 gc:universal NODE_474_length_7000_cov_1.160122:3364-2048(-)
MFQLQIGKPRRDYGKQPEFTSQFYEFEHKIEANLVTQPNCCSVGTNAIHPYSIHSVNTNKTEFAHKQIMHREGGWPREIDYEDNEQTARYKKKIEKNEDFIKCVVNLGIEMERNIMINNALDIYEKNSANDPKLIDYTMEQVQIFKDFKNRSVKSIQFDCNYRQFVASYRDDIHTNAHIWALDDPVRPQISLLCGSQANSFQFNSKEQSQIIGGLQSGQISLWDIRKGSSCVSLSNLDNSHKSECTSICWLQSKTGTEIASVGLDGKILLWDSRKLDFPIETIDIEPNKENSTHSATCVDFDFSATTKFLVGTDTGIVYNCNRKGKNSAEKLGTAYISNTALLHSVQRCPFNSKNYVSFSSQGIRLWSEDVKTPLWKHEGGYSSGCVSQARPSLFFAGNSSGQIFSFDLNYSLLNPRTEFNVSFIQLGWLWNIFFKVK